MPIIEFKNTTNNIDFNSIDILLFTSKQGVKVTNSISKEWQKYPSIVIGDATKKEVLKLGGEVIYSPKKFYGEILAQEIKEKFRNKNILYLRPKIVSYDISSTLSNIREEIIYQTKCKRYSKKNIPPNNSIIIFTSPSTIRCFLKNFNWNNSYQAVVIGESTKKALPQYIKNYYISDRPMIDSCIEMALKLLQIDK